MRREPDYIVPLLWNIGCIANLKEDTVVQRRQRANCHHDQCVLIRWHPGVRAAFYLHLCIPQKGASSQQLAAVGEERSVGCFLQSCSNRDEASHRRGGFLLGHGLLRHLLKMIVRLDCRRLDGCGLGLDSSLWSCVNPCCGTPLGLYDRWNPTGPVNLCESEASAAPFWWLGH